MKKIICCGFALLLANVSKAQPSQFSLNKASSGLPYLHGKMQNQKNLYVTAGDRLYSIGDQAGNFPATGFHVKGEMGGIWQQPVKLMDGYRLTVSGKNGFKKLLDKSDEFTAYSFLNKNVYKLNSQLKVIRTQFVPDGIAALIVEYTFVNTGKTSLIYELDFNADVNLRPVWLGEENGLIDYGDELFKQDKTANIYTFKDKGNDWFVLLSADRKLDHTGTVKTPYAGKGITGVFKTSISIAAGKTETIRYYISGAYQNYNGAEASLKKVKSKVSALFSAKKQRYQELENMAKLTVPDAALMQGWQWGKYSTDWLVRDVPGMGRGMSAGLPDYPWFFSNDQGYTFNSLTGVIKPDLFYSSWKMLKKLSRAANGESGRIIHEASTNGVVYDKGRMEESQVHIETAWNIFRWTGNKEFLKENYVWAKKSLNWLMQHDTNHNLYVEGYGGVEIKGLDEEMLDVAVHTQRLFQVMAEMAAVLGDEKNISAYQAKADTLKLNINRDWWIDSENRYADFITDPKKAIDIIDTAMVQRIHPGRNDWALKKLTTLREQIIKNQYKGNGYLVYYNTSAVLPLKEGIADSVKALKLLRNIGWFANKYGLYISGIERPDDLSSDEKSVYERNKGEFSYNQAVMPAATASLAIAECRYGSPDTALMYMHKTLNSFSYATPGTTYEVAPDYGMFVQAWNITGLYTPVIKYFFGIDPDAYNKKINISPRFPEKWKTAVIENILIGDTKLSVKYKKQGNELTFSIHSTAPGWKISFEPERATELWLNGKKISVAAQVVLTGAENTIVYKN